VASTFTRAGRLILAFLKFRIKSFLFIYYRKFNARKEDVDNMNHLGLRIYRFYIKCTACLSEISFRTDPANTDYVLEAGATRLVLSLFPRRCVFLE
jgi:hypothetical protein